MSFGIFGKNLVGVTTPLISKVTKQIRKKINVKCQMLSKLLLLLLSSKELMTIIITFRAFANDASDEK